MRKVLHLFQKLGQLLDSNLEEPNLKFVFVGGSCQIGTAEQMLAWLVCWGWQCSPTSPCGRIRMRFTWFSQCQRWWLCSSRLMSADIWKMPLPLGVASVEPKHWEATSAYKRMSYIQPGFPQKKTSGFPASSHQSPLRSNYVKPLIPTCGKFLLTKGL